MRFPRTFIFVDLSGFTHYTETNGDEAATGLLARFRASARAVGSHHGVRIDKYLGDGLMAVAVEAAVGVIFALELQRHAISSCAPLALRIGVATGETMLFEGQDYIGSAPNLAARLCDAAGGIGTLIPADQATDLPPGIIAHALDPIVLPGFPLPIEVVSLSGEPVLDMRYDTSDLWARS
ncbi:MAG: adenylate/guanylate cyclase domain-containing protein [Ilumatobacteraceae bacterium]